MNDFTQIVKDALEYYDENENKYYDKCNSFKYYKLDIEKGKIYFFDKGKKELYESTYGIIGKYIYSGGIWVWGWSNGEFNKQQISTSRRVLNYALDLDKKDILMKTELITSRMQITSVIQADIHAAMASFLSKQPFIFKLYYYDSKSYENEYFKLRKHANPLGVLYLVLNEK